MPTGGKLTIETANAYLDALYAAANADVVEGQYVMIAVTDTGEGMSRDTIDKAFDPFFTTKPDGRGTGLGLSQVHGFLKQSGGHVKIYSGLGEGTTVKLYLPRFRGQDEDEAWQAPMTIPGSVANESILVVEDDERVRATTVALIKELGYHVLEADSALAALRIVDSETTIDLMFTDVVMPDMNGRKLANAVQERRPNLPILFTTGYTRNAIVHNGILDPGVELLIKPFTLETLSGKLRELLARARTMR
jgi:CheY-like chemotaxis protein